jgi:hypothetical protein
MERLCMLACAVLLAAAPAAAQRTTEQFIPIGQSPGVSGKLTVIGTIGSVDAAGRTFTVTTPSGPVRIALGDQTRVWIDASRVQKPARRGGIGDVQGGRRVEVLFEDPSTHTRALWVKIEAASP